MKDREIAEEDALCAIMGAAMLMVATELLIQHGEKFRDKWDGLLCNAIVGMLTIGDRPILRGGDDPRPLLQMIRDTLDAGPEGNWSRHREPIEEAAKEAGYDNHPEIDAWFKMMHMMLPQSPAAARPPSLREAIYAHVISTMGRGAPIETIESFVNGLEIGCMAALKAAWEEKAWPP